MLITIQCTEFNKYFRFIKGLEEVDRVYQTFIQCSKNWTKLQDFFGSVDKCWKSFEGRVDNVAIFLISYIL